MSLKIDFPSQYHTVIIYCNCNSISDSLFLPDRHELGDKRCRTRVVRRHVVEQLIAFDKLLHYQCGQFERDHRVKYKPPTPHKSIRPECDGVILTTDSIYDVQFVLTVFLSFFFKRPRLISQWLIFNKLGRDLRRWVRKVQITIRQWTSTFLFFSSFSAQLSPLTRLRLQTTIKSDSSKGRPDIAPQLIYALCP